MPDAVTVLSSEKRDERGSRPAGRLRRAGRVPAVVYGLGGENLTVTVPERELNQILHSDSGVNTVITLKVDGSDQLTLARQIQRHPVRGDLLHVDFIRVDPDVLVAAEVPVHLEGEPEGVRIGGVLEQLVFTLSIEAKPSDIPNSIEVDVTALQIGDQLRVEELALPPGVQVTQELDELVAQVVMPRVVEEEPTEAEEGEEAEGVEGEAAEEGAPPADTEGAGERAGGEESGGE